MKNIAKTNRLNPRIDKTNFINDVTRNKIRNIVIPYIKNEFNPNFINTLDRLSNVITEEDEYMKKKTIEVYNKIKIQEKEGYIVLDLKEFNKQEEVIRKRLINLHNNSSPRKFTKYRKSKY